MPTNSDLVTDLPADFEVFGQAVDTSLADLKGGTTGQILAKATNTDMDFTWITNDVGDITAVTAGTGISGGGTSGAVTVTNSMATTMTTKGDLVPATASGAFARLAAGANGTTLVADSSASTGLKYSSNAPLGGMTLLNTGGTALTGAATITISGISNKSRFLVILENASTNTGGSYIGLRLNGAASGYGFTGITITNGITVSNGSNFVTDRMYTARQGASAADTFGFIANIDGGFDAGVLSWSSNGIASGTNGEAYNSKGFITTSAQVTSISIVGNNNFDAGTIYVYGA